VSEGLTAGKNEKSLADLVSVVTKKPASATWLPATTLPIPIGTLRLRESTPPSTVIDYEFRYRVDYDTLADPDTGLITTWAAAARDFQLCDVLGRLAESGLPLQSCVEELGDARPSGGWGQIRCITLALDAALAESLGMVRQLGWDGPIPLETSLQRAPWANCLLLRTGGGPQVRRTSGLSLGWLPAGAGSVDLVLAEQIEIVNAGRQTVATIHVIPTPKVSPSSVRGSGEGGYEPAGLRAYLEKLVVQARREVERHRDDDR
jgi:hypothetical protein